jgi:hypothetical protein
MLEDTALDEEPVQDGPRAAGGPGQGGGVDGSPTTGAHPALPVLDDAARSHAPGVCPFLRAEVDGALVAPANRPREGQACIAIGAPRPQSTSQQELVCLRAAHADCPRYQRGSLVPPATVARSVPAMPRATLAALLILVLSAGISFGYVVQRGGLDMPVASPSTSGGMLAAASPSPEPTRVPASVPAATPGASLAIASPASTPSTSPSTSLSPSPVVAATPTAAPTATPTTAPTARPTASPTPKPKPTATTRSNRYKLLAKCPDRDGCWIYRVRSGDNLFSIAKYFGHSLSTLYAWNPQYPSTRLKVGAEIRMPPPTR